MTKKILLEAHNIKNMYSGFGQFNYWLIKNLISNNNEFEFIVNAKSKTSIREFKDQVSFQKYYSLNRYELFRTRKKYDLWHSLNQNSKIEPLHKMPYILTLHDVIFLEKDPIDIINKKDIDNLQRKIDRCDAIAYISQHAKKSANHYLNIPSSLEQPIIYNGNPVIASKEKLEKPFMDFNLNKPFLFCIGQFLEMKNFHSLIGLLNYLKPDYQLVIAGNNDKPYKDVVLQEINKYKLKDKVFLPGKISEQEKHYYLQNCQAFLFPSLFEGFGLPPIEAMAYGKPVFLANRTSLPEIGGEYSFYWDDFDPENMASVFTNGMNIFEKNKATYVSELKKRAEKFNWDTTAKEYIKLYTKILS
tara:strand:- start:32 stop:1108 length:1077 start_codon:yes stop_codon:yes gene_type:complete